MKALALLACGLLAACDGPQEDAGEKADANSGAVSSEDTIESGPNETMGERRDDAAESLRDANEARADALEAQAEQGRDAAEEKAEALEQEADKTRGR